MNKKRAEELRPKTYIALRTLQRYGTACGSKRVSRVEINPVATATGSVPGRLVAPFRQLREVHYQFRNLSPANFLSATERDRALERCPYGFREHREQAAFFHLVNCFGGRAPRRGDHVAQLGGVLM